MRPIILLLCVFLAAFPCRSDAEEVSLSETWTDLGASRLEGHEMVKADRLALDLGGALFRVRHGAFFAASAVAGQAREFVFLGEATLELEPPDAVEAHQLELFTGKERLEELVDQAVLVINHDAAAKGIAQRLAPSPDDPGLVERAKELYREWRESAARESLGVELAMFRDALGDPLARDAFVGWFRSDELGDFLLQHAIGAPEQVRLGRFVPGAGEDVEQPDGHGFLRGRELGQESTDLGRWDTWVSMAKRYPDGSGGVRVVPGFRGFRPLRYELDLSLAEKDLRADGRTRIHLEPTFEGARFVEMTIGEDLRVHSVVHDGRKEFFLQTGERILVALADLAAMDSERVLEIHYEGRVLEETAGHDYRSTGFGRWYPRLDDLTAVPHEMTFRWPEELELVASGTRVEAGSAEPGYRLERRRADVPTRWVGFEVGRFELLEQQVGKVRVSLVVDRSLHKHSFEEDRERVLATIAGSLAFFEEGFGPYPLEELTVAIVKRHDSQSSLGFVSLPSYVISRDFWQKGYDLGSRQTLIAHEVAHQWWGEAISVQSYRDEWISEALAGYGASLFARRVLQDTGLARGAARNWQLAMMASTPTGRPVEALGPLVLGRRLDSTYSRGAGQGLLHKKSVVVAQTLAYLLGEERFLGALAEIVRALGSRALGTSDFLRLLEQGSGVDLDAYAERFVYGTGQPAFHYDYQIEPLASGNWRVSGEVRRVSPFFHEHQVVTLPDGELGVQRIYTKTPFDSVPKPGLVVPVQSSLFDPALGDQKKRILGQVMSDPLRDGNSLVESRFRISGETESFVFELGHEPKRFWFDKEQEIFARFVDRKRNPKWSLWELGHEAYAEGRFDQALELFRKSLAAEIPISTYGTRPATQRESDRFDARCHLAIAELLLENGRVGEARQSLEHVRDTVQGRQREPFLQQLLLLESRLALRDGDAGGALDRLERARRAGHLDTAELLLIEGLVSLRLGRVEAARTAARSAIDLGGDAGILLASLRSR